MGRIGFWFLKDADFVLGREDFSTLELVQTRSLPNYQKGVPKKSLQGPSSPAAPQRGDLASSLPPGMSQAVK